MFLGIYNIDKYVSRITNFCYQRNTWDSQNDASSISYLILFLILKYKILLHDFIICGSNSHRL